jgi:hypothetical protein
MQVVNVKKQMTSALDGLSNVPKKEAPRNPKEMKQREKERKQDFERRKQEREQRKSLVAEKWSTHRKSNADCQAPGKLGQVLNDTKQAVAHVAKPKKDEKGKEGRGSWWSDQKAEDGATPSKPAARRESAAERLSKVNPPKPEKKSTKKATPTKPAPSPDASGGGGDSWSKPTAAPAPAPGPAPAKTTGGGGGGGGGGQWWEQE